MADGCFRILLDGSHCNRNGAQIQPATTSVHQAQHDRTQLSYLGEECILVNREDVCVGKAAKRDAHLWTNIVTGGYLHRAFSVFLFNEKEELLLQRRSHCKITFPGVWTNTCCSHPLHREEELEDAVGVRRAAQRKLAHELGLSAEKVPLDCLELITRILYKAKSNEEWGEHELDYVFLMKSDAVPLPNPNEVSDVRYVNRNTLRQLIAQNFLFRWWDSLNDLSRQKDNKIHDLVEYGLSGSRKSPLSW